MKENRSINIFFTMVMFVFVVGSRAILASEINITVPKGISEVIQKFTPQEGYVFYALETATLKTIEEITECILLIALPNEDGLTIGITLVNSSFKEIGKPLFKTFKIYKISNNLSCSNSQGPCATEKSEVAFETGTKYPFESLIFGQETSIDILLTKITEDMQQQQVKTMLLLTKRGLEFKNKDKMIEVKFIQVQSQGK